MERIDHAAEANRLMTLASNPRDASTETIALCAQTHATLALVEQQRIANLIALGMVKTQPPMAEVVGPHWELDKKAEWMCARHPNIAAALGIEAEG